MKVQKQIILWCIGIICLLTSCEKDDTPTKINPADYVKYATETTATYGLVGKVKTVEKIKYYAHWDDENSTVQKEGESRSKIVYEFDENGTLIRSTQYYRYDNEMRPTSTYKIEYDSIYRLKNELYESLTSRPSFDLRDETGQLKSVFAIKYTYEYSDKEGITTFIQWYKENYEGTFKPLRKELYPLNDQNRINYSGEIQIYKPKVRTKESPIQSNKEQTYTERTNIFTKKDSKGNIVESYSRYDDKNNYGDTFTSIDSYSYYEQKITYYDGPASGKLTDEITGNAAAQLTKDIPALITTNNLKLNGKVKSTTEYQYNLGDEPDAWDPQTNTVTKKGDLIYKFVDQYNPLGILTERITYFEFFYNNPQPRYIERYQIDSKSRITEYYKETYSYENGTIYSIYSKEKAVITYDDVNKKATLSNFSSRGNGEMKKNNYTYSFNLKEDGSIDNSYKETHITPRSTPASDGLFEEKPSKYQQFIKKDDSQNNWTLVYTLYKEVDASGKASYKINYYSERTITYY